MESQELLRNQWSRTMLKGKNDSEVHSRTSELCYFKDASLTNTLSKVLVHKELYKFNSYTLNTCMVSVIAGPMSCPVYLKRVV